MHFKSVSGDSLGKEPSPSSEKHCSRVVDGTQGENVCREVGSAQHGGLPVLGRTRSGRSPQRSWEWGEIEGIDCSPKEQDKC